jgi:hypothetical protein
MAPPLMLTLSDDSPVSACQGSTTDANASLTSKTSMSSMLRPALASTFIVAGMTPVSMKIGSSPATANEWTRARALRPSAVAHVPTTAGNVGVRVRVEARWRPALAA